MRRSSHGEYFREIRCRPRGRAEEDRADDYRERQEGAEDDGAGAGDDDSRDYPWVDCRASRGGG